jgi:hypothetical protein
LKILKALEVEGWMKTLFPAWTSAKADLDALDALREVLVQLQMQGVNPDPSSAQAQLLTAKLATKDLAALKKLFVRPGFVHEWETQEDRAKEFSKRLTGKEAAMPSAAWKLFTSSDPEAVLWLGLTSKNGAVQTKYRDFFTVWPEARQRIPYALMQEMRITPELEGYQELLKSIFFELIDGKLTTDEEIRAFLEPHSPPAPPPPVSIRRTRTKRSDKSRVFREADEEEHAEARVAHGDEDGDEDGDLGDEIDSGDEHPELIARVMPEIVSRPPVVVPAAETPAKASPGVPQKAPEKVAPHAVQETSSKLEVSKSSGKPAQKAPAAPSTKVSTAAPAKADAKPPAKSVSKLVPAKTVAKSAGPKPAAKPHPKPSAKAKPASKSAAKAGGKKPALKRIAVKTAKGKVGKALVKPKPAKAIVKPKPTASKVKPALRPKPAKTAAKKPVKGSPAKSHSVKPAAAKASSAKKKH